MKDNEILISQVETFKIDEKLTDEDLVIDTNH